MIVLDIETTGLDPKRHSMLSLGAVDYESGDLFYGECRAEDGALIDPEALRINGFTHERAISKEIQSPEALYSAFLDYCRNRVRILGGQQVGSFDVLFLKEIHNKYIKTSWSFGHRTVDLHSVAYAKFGKSLSLDSILIECGLQPEPAIHNALVGAQLERDAFKILLTK